MYQYRFYFSLIGLLLMPISNASQVASDTRITFNNTDSDTYASQSATQIANPIVNKSSAARIQSTSQNQANAELQNWIIVNDTVMGGRSNADLVLADEYLHFYGQLSLENNGGFASTRRVHASVSWQNKQPIQIRLMGDGRQYQFRLRTNKTFNGVAYVANFQTQPNKLQTLSFKTDDFTAQFRGRKVQAPVLNLSEVNQIGFMLADKTPGQFNLKIAEIRQ